MSAARRIFRTPFGTRWKSGGGLPHFKSSAVSHAARALLGWRQPLPLFHRGRYRFKSCLLTLFLRRFYNSLTTEFRLTLKVCAMKTNFHLHKAGRLNEGWRIQNCARFFILAAIALLFSGATVSASDPVGLYALIDKVQYEPSDSKPERILIWGTFAVAEGERGEKYQSPVKGYIYFTLPEKKQEVALKEWADLKSVAGKKEVVGFSTRWGEPAKVRKDGEPPKEPDVFRTGIGVVRMDKRGSDYPPVKALLGTASKSTKQS